jgi:hypothetical protein
VQVQSALPVLALHVPPPLHVDAVHCSVGVQTPPSSDA